MIPEKIEVKLQSEIFNNFRCKMACDSVDLDIKITTIEHEFFGGNPVEVFEIALK